MFLTILLIIILTPVLIVYLKWRMMKRFWRKTGIPYYGPHHPIFGSLNFYQKENPSLWMRRLYESYNKTPYIGIFVFWRPGLLVNCPDLARRIFVKDFPNFKNRLLGSGKRDTVGRSNLVCVNDPLWSTIRKHLTPMFSAAKLRALQELFSSKTRDLVERFRNETERGLVIDIRSIYADYTTDIIGQSSFGVECLATRTGDSALRKTTRQLSEYSLWRGLSWSLVFFVPELADIFGCTFWPKKCTAYFRTVINKIVEERGGYTNEVNEGRDLLDYMIKMKQDADKDNEDISEDVVIGQAAIFLQAGFETSALVLTYATYELAFHPDIQERLHKELLDAKRSIGNKEFESEFLASLDFLNCVVKETLRKYPIMGWYDRVALNDYKVDDTLTIPAGTVIYLNAVSMHVDPQYFPEPLLFNPDRFSPENQKNIKPYTWMPFGEGPRGCIGKRFGMNTVRHALASVILNFEVRPWPNSRIPNDCELDPRGLLFQPAETLSVQLIPRNIET